MSSVPAAVTVRAPGKVNLALRVGRRRPDGYHPLATVFQAVSLTEEVTASVSRSGVELTVDGLHADRVPTGASNLAVRAALLLAGAVGVEPDVRLHLRKGVPVAGGMAGGSADAAATLVACDALWGTGLHRDALAELAAELGADVPFCLHGGTALGTGRGDLLSPVLTRGRYHWVLALHDAGLSTPAVFSRFDDEAGTRAPDEPAVDAALLAALRGGDPAAVGRALSNDLQPPAVVMAPHLAATLAVAEQAGALGVLVSGSGPTVAALAGSRTHAMTVAGALRAAGVADEVLLATGPVPGARLVQV